MTVSIPEDSVTYLQHILSSLPRSHPERPGCLQLLALVQFIHQGSSQRSEKEDLDETILHLTEVVFLSLRTWDGSSANIVQLFYFLSIALLRRSIKYDQLEDLKCSVDYLRYLGDLPLEAFGVPRIVVTTSLVHALTTQVFQESGDVTQDIETMVILCYELLNSDISTIHSLRAVELMLGAALSQIGRGKRVQPLDQVIECTREALKICPPDFSDIHLGFAGALTIRYLILHLEEDYKEATAVLEQVISSHPDNVSAPALLAGLVHTRSVVYKNPELSEEAMSHFRTLLGNPSFPDQLRASATEALAIHTRLRFKRFGRTEDLLNARSGISEIVDLSPSQSMRASGRGIAQLNAVQAPYNVNAVDNRIQHLLGILSTSSPGSDQHRMYLRSLVGWCDAKFSFTNDLADMQESIKYRRMLLASSHLTDPFRYIPLSSLAIAVFDAFRISGETAYLEESIPLLRDVQEMKGTAMAHFDLTSYLLLALFARLQLFARVEDLNEIMQLFPAAANDPHAAVSDRFGAACIWASFARGAWHSSTSTAYETAMSLMQGSLVFAPTLKIQHDRLVAVRGHCERMPLEYASLQLQKGRLEHAIETLERGRALLWSEMRGFRTSIDRLLGMDSPLAVRFAAINRDLQELAMSNVPHGDLEADDKGPEGEGNIDPFGRLVIKQRKLLQERDTLISQIEDLPGFNDMALAAPSFDTLRSAGSNGPIITINHCQWRSDILIISHGSPPSLIPTPGDFYERANKLKDQLLDTRKKCGLDSEMYELTLASVLADLYELVGRPVIDKLRELNVPEQSRVWWCPTSVFCSLPLHAMGPVPSDDNNGQYFSDLYISSYTPTLSTLIESRRPGTQSSGRPSLLLVAQPDESLPGVWGEMEIIQELNTQVTGLILEDATPTAVLAGLRDHRFVHFSCHGTLETGKPFNASFELGGGQRLTLLDIVRSRLPAAEFAFLSACHTAELTDESVADEGLHLAAAMQYCGFRSVVGTMWAMADTDGRDLAKNFYKLMFSRKGNLRGTPYYERSVAALRDSVQKLRRQRGVTLERWVNFVHYGA
jgi:tetratricopeptide (TPR) repeat protein